MHFTTFLGGFLIKNIGDPIGRNRKNYSYLVPQHIKKFYATMSLGFRISQKVVKMRVFSGWP